MAAGVRAVHVMRPVYKQEPPPPPPPSPMPGKTTTMHPIGWRWTQQCTGFHSLPRQVTSCLLKASYQRASGSQLLACGRVPSSTGLVGQQLVVNRLYKLHLMHCNCYEPSQACISSRCVQQWSAAELLVRMACALATLPAGCLFCLGCRHLHNRASRTAAAYGFG